MPAACMVSELILRFLMFSPPLHNFFHRHMPRINNNVAIIYCYRIL